MWIVCFYIGPGLSEIRHQTPDGQEARKPVKKDRSTLPIISNPCCLQAKEYPTKVHWVVPSLSPGPSRPPSPQSRPPVPRRQGVQEEKNFSPRWILIRRRGLVACQARANARWLLIKGLRKFPPSGGTKTTKRRGSLQKLAARPARVARLDDARRVGAAQPFACPNLHPGPIQASPGQPFRFVGHLRSARWAPACPITIRCLGLAPQAEQIAAVLTPAYQAAPCIHTPRAPYPRPLALP